MYPDLLNRTIESFKKFNGIGSKSAERLAFSVLEMSLEDVSLIANNIIELKNNITKCKVCGNISDKELCSICYNKNRDNSIICVVEDYKSIFMFEKTENYTGKYHVLNGVISPIDGINPEDLNISSLVDRVSKNNVKTEIILALKPSIEGEATILYLKKILEKYNVKITRLAYGIPIGVDIDYLDLMTLDRALQDRKDI